MKKHVKENGITREQWLINAKNLYENLTERKCPQEISIEEMVFTKEDVQEGIKRLASGKAKDINRLQ